MKKLVTTLALSMSAIFATSAMAAPHHGYDQNRASTHTKAPQHAAKPPVKSDQHKAPQHAAKPPQHKAPPHVAQSKNLKNNQFRVGQSLPRAFDSKQYHVNQKDARQLAKPSRNQQWYKIHGNYVLVNEKNNQIVSILS